MINEIEGLKDKYYNEGFEEALLWILDLAKDENNDLDYITWKIKNILNNEN